jgi:hypothetical protein
MPEIIDKPMITDHEEAMELHLPGRYYRPIQYLSRYLFSESILLDVFCTGYFISSSEDDYYNNLNIDMVAKYQPHIDIDRFMQLWQDLEEVLQLELVAEYIEQGLYLNTNVDYRHESIHQFIDGYINNSRITNVVSFFNDQLFENKYSIKMGWDANIIDSIDDAVELSREILIKSPDKYSSILPL